MVSPYNYIEKVYMFLPDSITMTISGDRIVGEKKREKKRTSFFTLF